MSLDVSGVLTTKEDEPIDSFDKRGTTTRQNIDSHYLALRCPRISTKFPQPKSFSTLTWGLRSTVKSRLPYLNLQKQISPLHTLCFLKRNGPNGAHSKQNGINITCKWKICERENIMKARKNINLGNLKTAMKQNITRKL